MKSCHVIGDVGTGKTWFVRKVMDEFLVRDDVVVAGYSQPCLEQNGERVGYELEVICQDQTVKTVSLAKRKGRAKPGEIPFTFEEEAFALVEAEAGLFCSEGRPVLLLLDEIGRLEISKSGHFGSICRLVERLRPQVVVAVFNPIRRSEVLVLLAELGIPEPSISIETPLAETRVGELINDINSLIVSLRNHDD
jgi:nucleoside-triphosphatase THEP1